MGPTVSSLSRFVLSRKTWMVSALHCKICSDLHCFMSGEVGQKKKQVLGMQMMQDTQNYSPAAIEGIH